MRKRSLLAGSLVAAAVVAATSLAARGGDDLDPARARRAAAALRDPRSAAREIDAALEAAWKAQGLAPAPRASDEEFVRRVYLDVVGAVPTAAQVEGFLEDAHPEKRERLVESLLASPGYARHFANLWSEVLVGAGGPDKNQDFVPAVFRPWLEKEIAARRSYPELIETLLTATGNPYTSAPVNFYGRRAFTATDVAGGVAQAFLGVRIQCAQCHDHPYEEMKQTDFQGMAAFFARMTMRPADIPYEIYGERGMKRLEEREEQRVRELVQGGAAEEQAREMVRRQRPRTVEIGELTGAARLPRRAEMNQKRLEKVPAEVAAARPKFLMGAVYDDAEGSTRREALAKWIANPLNPYTARALANRYWGWFMGRGFVHPVDDFNASNPPSVPAALDALARDTAESEFDLDRLVRVITLTKAYQLSTAVPARGEASAPFFAHGPLKQLTPQQTFDSLQVALGVVDDPTQMTDVAGAAPSAIEMEGGRFGQMAMGGDGDKKRSGAMLSLAARSFFQTFDDDEGGGSTAFEGTVPQGLFLMNSQVVNGLLSNAALSVVPAVLKRHDDERARIRELSMRTLSRAPTAKEMDRFLRYVKSAASAEPPPAPPKARGMPPMRRGEDPQAAAYADVLWALVASSEFGTNH